MFKFLLTLLFLITLLAPMVCAEEKLRERTRTVTLKPDVEIPKTVGTCSVFWEEKWVNWFNAILSLFPVLPEYSNFSGNTDFSRDFIAQKYRFVILAQMGKTHETLSMLKRWRVTSDDAVSELGILAHLLDKAAKRSTSTSSETLNKVFQALLGTATKLVKEHGFEIRKTTSLAPFAHNEALEIIKDGVVISVFDPELSYFLLDHDELFFDRVLLLRELKDLFPVQVFKSPSMNLKRAFKQARSRVEQEYVLALDRLEKYRQANSNHQTASIPLEYLESQLRKAIARLEQVQMQIIKVARSNGVEKYHVISMGYTKEPHPIFYLIPR